MFDDLEAYGDLDPLYVKQREKVPTGKLSKEQADALLKQEMRDNAPKKNSAFLTDMFGNKSGYETSKEAEQAAMEKARPMFEKLQERGDLDIKNDLPVVTRYKGGDDIAVAKSIRRNMSKEYPNFKWRKDENGNYDYDHFVKDPTRAEYLRTLSSTYKNPDKIIPGVHNNEPREYLLKRYYNPENGQNVYDIDVKTNEALINKIAREGRKGQHEFKKIMRQTPQASEADLGLSQTGNAPSSTLRVNSNISHLGEVVNSNDVIGDVIKKVKGSYSMLKGLPDTDARVILEARKLLSSQTKSADKTLAYQAKQALKEFDDALPADFRQELQEANKIYSDMYQFSNAKDTAQEVFNSKISPEEFSDKFG